VVRGAREHNLQNVDLTLARNQLICFTGVSGSGKSSLAFDTLYAEGQRRYLESLSTFARQFVGQLPKPDVDYLSGLSPAISISQKSTGNNPRSTVGTITEIHDFLRVLYARVGTGFCPDCHTEITSQTRDQMVAKIELLPPSTYFVLAPIIRGQKGEYRDLFEDLRKQGFNRARVDSEIVLLNNPPDLERQSKHTIELVVNRIHPTRSTTVEIGAAVEMALKYGDGTMFLAVDTAEASAPISSHDIIFSQTYACATCGVSFSPPTPQLLSFNSPQGCCQNCQGLGETLSFVPDRLLTNPDKSTEMTRWYRRSITMFCKIIESFEGLPFDSLFSTPWKNLSAQQQDWLLFGYNGKFAKAKGKALHGEPFTGIVPELLATYGGSKNANLRKQYEGYMSVTQCSECRGGRLNRQARSIRLKSLLSAASAEPEAVVTTTKSAKKKTAKKAAPKKATKKVSNKSKTAEVSASVEVQWKAINELSSMSIADCSKFFEHIELTELQWKIGNEAIKEIRARLQFLVGVGLGYLSLERTSPTLSGGESQRIRLASQIGAGLVGVLYVLDEPSIGLHPRDNDQLLTSLERLRDLGNTLIVVEHDEDTMRIADTIVDFGPGPGVRGGHLVASGSMEEIAANPQSITGGFLSRTRTIRRPEVRRKGSGKKLKVRGAAHHNLKSIDVDIPLGSFVVVTGVSGSGKSSLITDIVSPVLRNALNKAEDKPGKHKSIDGIEHLDKIIDVDQSPIGKTPRSNPATYIKLFDEIRNLFAELPESKRRGFNSSVFSFNTEQGRCTACDGHGATRLDMEFLADLWVPCPICEGKRYARPTLQVEFKGKNIAECLELDVQQAIEHFGSFPRIVEKLQTLRDVGLDYLKIGQPSPTLSGGEAQRIKLSKELSRRSTGKTIYVLDEPTTGLHFYDIDLLLGVLQSLVDRGNTVIVVEHNLDLIQAADWIIDMGPEGGAGGGEIVCQGTPEEVAANPNSYTGRALAKYFEDHKPVQRTTKKKATKKVASSANPTKPLATIGPSRNEVSIALQDIEITGAAQHNLKGVDLTIPRHQMTVFCGHSGSGKTSMAMDTIYAEGQRRFVESLSPTFGSLSDKCLRPMSNKYEA
jgi:excinuclease ABC subunit A